MFLLNNNQSTDMQFKSLDRFLYDINIDLELVKKIHCRIWKKMKSPFIQKQPTRGKRGLKILETWSENMQQIYRGTRMPKFDFNKVAEQLYRNHISAWVFSCKFDVYFQNCFSYEHLPMAASVNIPCSQVN